VTKPRVMRGFVFYCLIHWRFERALIRPELPDDFL